MDWQLFNIWIIAFFTLALFSFMYKDNPVYKVAEHIFAGLSAGYQVGLVWHTIILQQLWEPMLQGSWWLFMPGILGVLMFSRFFSKFSWISRTSLAFVMGVTSGIFIISQLHGLVLPQMQNTMQPPSEVVVETVDGFDQNGAELTVTDGSESADSLVALTPETDSTLAAIAATVDETLAAVDSVAGEEVSAGTFAQLTLVENVNAQDSLVDRIGDSVLLQATFADTASLSIDEYYAVKFLIRNSETTTKTTLASSTAYSSEDIEVTDNNDGTFTATYIFDPADDLETGNYDLQFEVERRSIKMLLAIIIVVGVIATLIFFYFSKPHTGLLGVTAKVGIWFIMISFGAHFGYTVMGRVSLLIGRVQFLIQDWIGSFL